MEYEKKGVVFRAAAEFEAAGGVRHGFSTRLGGVSTGTWASMNLGTTRGDDPDHVRENYRRFCAAIGADVHSVVMSNQVHESHVRVVTRPTSRATFSGPRAIGPTGCLPTSRAWC